MRKEDRGKEERGKEEEGGGGSARNRAWRGGGNREESGRDLGLSGEAGHGCNPPPPPARAAEWWRAATSAGVEQAGVEGR